MKKKFLNCGCNYDWLSKIWDHKNCGILITHCKQCNRSLTPCWQLRTIKLFETKEEAQEYRNKIFANPEKTLLAAMIPGPWEGLNIEINNLLKENFNLINSK